MKNIDENKLRIQNEAVEEIEKNNFNGLVNVSVRVGKTLIGILSIVRSGYEKVLWVVPDTKSRDVDVKAEFDKQEYSDEFKKVKTICYSSLGKHEGDYDLVILDEVQHITDKNTQNLINGKIKYKSLLALTGTPPKSYSKIYILKQLKISQIYKYTRDQAAEDHIVSNYKINVIYFDLDDSHAYIKGANKMFTEKERYRSYTNAIAWKEANFEPYSGLIEVRTKLLYSLKSKLDAIRQLRRNIEADKNARGLTFVNFKKDAESFGPHYHSSSGDKHYNNFRDEKINHLTLVKKGSVGHTYAKVNYVIIGQVTRDFIGTTSQAWGRGLLNDTENLDIYILCAKNTVEEQWLEKSLKDINPEKIKYFYAKNS